MVAPVTKDMRVVDSRGHLLGRLASVVAKQLLNGETVVLLRCEEVRMSGSLFRNKTRFWAFLRKRHNTNPKRGPFHERAPSKMVYRTIRGMIPHKTARGKAALARLHVFDGIPPRYVKVKKMVIPDALKILHVRSDRTTCCLGDLANDMGWSHQRLIADLATQRNADSTAWFAKKQQLDAKLEKATEKVNASQPQLIEDLTALGY